MLAPTTPTEATDLTGPPDPDASQDAEVVAQSLDEPELFARLYDRYAPDIHRYATRRLGVGAADDITAETFLIAFRTRVRYDTDRPNARPWLYGIAGNLIGKQRRAEVRPCGRWPAPDTTRSPSPGPSVPTPGSPHSRRTPHSPGRWSVCPPVTGTCCCSWPGRI